MRAGKYSNQQPGIVALALTALCLPNLSFAGPDPNGANGYARGRANSKPPSSS